MKSPNTALNFEGDVCHLVQRQILIHSCSRFKILESELELSLKRSLQIKEDKMAALEMRLQESSFLNQQLRQELKTVSQV